MFRPRPLFQLPPAAAATLTASNVDRNTSRTPYLTEAPPAPQETPLSVACASSLWAALLKGAATILPIPEKRWPRRLSNTSDKAYAGRCHKRLCIALAGPNLSLIRPSS